MEGETQQTPTHEACQCKDIWLLFPWSLPASGIEPITLQNSGLTNRKAHLTQLLPKRNGLVVALLFSQCLLLLGWLCTDNLYLFYVSFICLFQVHLKVCGN